ncbi:MAG: B12-binding domain-containing radical SAM protein, partial [Armatimonadetes bacterium]|nr:B12-binding domain-containing radical SAM protein [Armatimonadota bacterium]
EAILAATGYDSMSLLSLNCPDHPDITQLIDRLNERLQQRHISIGLPSLRVDSFSVGLAERVQRVRKSGLTFAPEAGSQRLRDIINKCVTDDDLFAAARAAFDNGWQRLKLYFMIGLPFEREEDVAAIASLVSSVLALARERLGRSAYGRLKIAVSVNAFVPKPHTPFQWLGQDAIERLEETRELLRRSIDNHRVHWSFSDMRQSALEAALARGDRRLGPVILSAWRAGALYDSWSECFRPDIWLDAFSRHGLDLEEEATREIPLDADLPWDIVDAGVTAAFLRDELERARQGATTGDCRWDGCQACGMTALVAPCPSDGSMSELREQGAS